MDVPQIKDREHLEAWLKTRSREECIAIAHRAAMRVAPLWIGWIKFSAGERNSSSTEVVFFSPLLISGVAAFSATPEIKSAVRISNAFADPNIPIASTFAATAISHAAAAVTAVIDIFFASQATTAAASAVAAAASFAANLNPAAAAAIATLASEEVWKVIWQDLNAVQSGINPLVLPLWLEAENPIAGEWTRARADLVARGPDWDFWVRWYDAALRGEPMNWKMQEKIALISPEVWEGDVSGLAEKIREIEIDFAISATPNAEVIELNPETGKFRSVPDSRLPADHLADVQQKIEDAADTFEGKENSDNCYTALRDDIAYLRRRASRDQNKPRALFDLCQSVIRRTKARVRDGTLPPDDALVTDFVHQLNEASVDIANFDEKVKEVALARVLMRPVVVDPAMATTISLVANKFALFTEGELVEDIPEDARLIVDPDTNGDARKAAAYREVSRFANLWKLFKTLDAKGKAVAGFVTLAGFSAGVLAIVELLTLVAKVVGYLFGIFF